MSGFRIVDNVTHARREKACLACPHLIYPEGPSPDKNQIGKGICAKDGARAAAKIRIPAEECPEAHPDKQAFSRWGELIDPHFLP